MSIASIYSLMHKLRLLIVFIVAATCPFLGVLHIGHTGITDNMALGSCSALSIGGGATSSSVDNESGSSSFFTGEPIDIPVSIAKGIEPVDATRFQVSAGGGLNLVKPQSQLLVKQLSASVTISG